jgi:hypothetical protein
LFWPTTTRPSRAKGLRKRLLKQAQKLRCHPWDNCIVVFPDDSAKASALHTKNQQLLIEFLETDLDLAFTIIETARIEHELDPPQCESALAKARMALATVRQFFGRIEDANARGEVHNRADELQSALDAFPRSLKQTSGDYRG